jgi:hypothetical protein
MFFCLLARLLAKLPKLRLKPPPKWRLKLPLKLYMLLS